MTPTPEPTGKPEARVIKYRQWVIPAKEFAYWGFYADPDTQSHWQGPCTDLRLVAPSQQFTGLFDRTGKEIYEGDIVKIPDDWDKFGFMAGEKRQIIFKDGGFRFAPKEGYKGRGHWLEDAAGLEVIGNIMQNQELLA